MSEDNNAVIRRLVPEGDVVGRFTCSATHLGEWRGHAPTGRRFEPASVPLARAGSPGLRPPAR